MYTYSIYHQFENNTENMILGQRQGRRRLRISSINYLVDEIHSSIVNALLTVSSEFGAFENDLINIGRKHCLRYFKKVLCEEVDLPFYKSKTFFDIPSLKADYFKVINDFEKDKFAFTFKVVTGGKVQLMIKIVFSKISLEGSNIPFLGENELLKLLGFHVNHKYLLSSNDLRSYLNIVGLNLFKDFVEELNFDSFSAPFAEEIKEMAKNNTINRHDVSLAKRMSIEESIRYLEMLIEKSILVSTYAKEIHTMLETSLKKKESDHVDFDHVDFDTMQYRSGISRIARRMDTYFFIKKMEDYLKKNFINQITLYDLINDEVKKRVFKE